MPKASTFSTGLGRGFVPAAAMPSRAFLPGKVLTFYPHRKAPLRPTLWNAVTPSWFPFICTDCIQKRITRLLMLCAMRLSSHRR
jgi:hypothetical protein